MVGRVVGKASFSIQTNWNFCHEGLQEVLAMGSYLDLPQQVVLPLPEVLSLWKDPTTIGHVFCLSHKFVIVPMRVSSTECAIISITSVLKSVASVLNTDLLE
jgi:hypothetical protein